MRDGRRFGAPPKPYQPPTQPEGKINTTDPDSKNMKAYRGYVQGYNAQAVTTRAQIIVAAEIAPDGLDFAQLDPMVSAAEKELEGAGVTERPEVVLADAGYWSNDHIDRLRERGMTPLVAADADRSKGPRKTRLGGPYDFIEECSPPSPVAISTHEDRGWSSRSSPISSRTGGRGGSNAEAGRPSARNGA
jgi:hypothetical protein